MDIDTLIEIVKKHQIDAIHPGYGFLSESEVFSERMWKEAGAVVVGPGWEILANTGDKLKARQLAERCMSILRTICCLCADLDYRQCPCIAGFTNTHEQRGRRTPICS